VERGGHGNFGPEQLEQAYPKRRGELGTAIRHNVIWEPVQPENVPHEELASLLRRYGLVAGDEVSHLCQAVNNDKN